MSFFRHAILVLGIACAAPGAAKERTIIDPLPTPLVANMNVTAIEIAVAAEAADKIAQFDKKAAEKRADRKLAPFEPTAPVSEDERATVPLTTAVIDAATNGGPPAPPHHSPLFRIDPEPVVTLGATAMTAAVLDLLKPAT